ncbi:MAG TPA: SRPBCC family protein [Bacteroidia bacterium]
MLELKTEKESVNASASEVFAYLSDMNNFKDMLPNSATDWQATSENCSFKIGGMAKIGLQYKSKTPNSRIDMNSYGDVMFPYDLAIIIEENGAGCLVHMDFKGDVNPFMKMMVEAPLKNFFGYWGHALKKKFDAQA